ncbi:MAG: hypothetical protein PVH61_22100 [Candidatus Aminicenantes bacterium]|jgi:hypothetical protein
MNSEKKSTNIMGLPDWAIISIAVAAVIILVVIGFFFFTPSV